MKTSSNITANILLSILSLSFSAQAFAQNHTLSPPNQRVENLLNYGVDLPFLGRNSNLTPVPAVPKQEKQNDRQTEVPAHIWPEFTNQAEFHTLLPDLTHLQALMHNPEELEEISLSPIAGLYQVVIANDVYYLSRDGRYLFEGNLLDLSSRENLSDHRRNQMRRQLLSELNEIDVIAFAPKKAQHQVTVFIDVDCPYCRVIYDKADQYNELDIEMHFAPFPRNGPNSTAYAQLSAVWCASDRKQAMHQITQGLALSAVNCQEYIKKPHVVGMKMGVNATPTFVLENGSLIRGYVAPQNLARLLENQ